MVDSGVIEAGGCRKTCGAQLRRASIETLYTSGLRLEPAVLDRHRILQRTQDGRKGNEVLS
jgi:hypothetical protein